MRTPACVQLIKMQSQINVTWNQFWRVCGYVSMLTEAISPLKCVLTHSQMIEAVRSELSCDRGAVNTVARVIYELIRHQQPLSCGEGGLVSTIISIFSPILP